MREATRRERAKRLAAQWEQLPAERREKLLLLMWGNSLFTIALQASWLVLLVRASRRVMHQPDRRPGTVLRVVGSPPTLLLVTAGMIFHRVAAQLAIRAWDRRAPAS